MYNQKNLRTNVQTKIFTQIFKAELLTTVSHTQWKQSKCVSAGEWITKCGVLYNGTLIFNYNKERSTDMGYNMDEP